MTDALSVWTAFTATTIGRDKLYRTIQYFARFLAYYFARFGSVDGAKRLQLIAATVGMHRKCTPYLYSWFIVVVFRAGKPLDNLVVIIKALEQPDSVDKWLQITKATGFGGWLLLDTFQWLNATKIASFSNIDSINYYAPRFWAIGLVASASLNTRKLLQWRHESAQRIAAGTTIHAELRRIAEDEAGRQIAMDLVQDCVDLVIPLSLAGIVDPGQGVVGLCGTLTSVMAVQRLWAKHCQHGSK